MELNDIAGHISLENIETLQKYARLSIGVTGESVIADIGTCVGKSAITMALADKRIKVLTVDPNHNPVIEENLERFNLRGLQHNRVTYFCSTSLEFSKSCPILNMCFIDGDHSPVGVELDILNIATKVIQGGYVLFHDCNLYSNTIAAMVDKYNHDVYEKIEEVGGSLGDPKEGSIYVARRRL